MPTPPDIGGIMDAVLITTIITVVASLAVPLLIVGVVIWAIRRQVRDPAEQALRDRLARGEIDHAEFMVRLRALKEGDDRY